MKEIIPIERHKDAPSRYPKFRLVWHAYHGYWYVQLKEGFWRRWRYVHATPGEKKDPREIWLVCGTWDWAEALRARELPMAEKMGEICSLVHTRRELERLKRRRDKMVRYSNDPLI